MIILRGSRKVNTSNGTSTYMPKKLQRAQMEPGLLHRLTFCRVAIALRLGRPRVSDREIAELVAEGWGETPSNSSINQIFAGMQKDITTRQAAAIARAAGVDAGWLVTGEGNAPAGYVAPVEDAGDSGELGGGTRRKRPTPTPPRPAAPTFGNEATDEARKRIKRQSRRDRGAGGRGA